MDPPRKEHIVSSWYDRRDDSVLKVSAYELSYRDDHRPCSPFTVIKTSGMNLRNNMGASRLLLKEMLQSDLRIGWFDISFDDCDTSVCLRVWSWYGTLFIEFHGIRDIRSLVEEYPYGIIEIYLCRRYFFIWESHARERSMSWRYHRITIYGSSGKKIHRNKKKEWKYRSEPFHLWMRWSRCSLSCIHSFFHNQYQMRKKDRVSITGKFYYVKIKKVKVNYSPVALCSCFYFPEKGMIDSILTTSQALKELRVPNWKVTQIPYISGFDRFSRTLYMRLAVSYAVLSHMRVMIYETFYIQKSSVLPEHLDS